MVKMPLSLRQSLLLACLIFNAGVLDARAAGDEFVPPAPQKATRPNSLSSDGESSASTPVLPVGSALSADLGSATSSLNASAAVPSLAGAYAAADRADVSASLVSHGSSACSCGQCLQCTDRRPDTMLGGVGMVLGVGPCPTGSQCWQCPYDSPFDVHGPGEYAGPSRMHRIPEYRLRTGDSIQLTFMVTALTSEGAYRLVVGDELLIESEADDDLTRGTLERGLKIQPDGTITLRLIGQVHAAGQSVDQLRELLEKKYTEFYPTPSIDVTPVNTGSAARQVREAISGAGGFDPQQIQQTITPAGEIRLPKIGSVQSQGLTLDELKQEINLRYDAAVGGLEVEPSLLSQAPHNVFVLGEVGQPGRFEMDNTPTTVLGAIAMAGGHRTGANMRQVVVFRRGDSWELTSTVLDLRGAVLGREAHPRDEIWVRDGDVIILPSTPIRLFDNFVRQVFTEGIYGIIPITASYNFGGSFSN
ncbi:Polysaccharide biosynthesis/export protein [Rubripirellula lacrimiformis]|uniref:Polysaccharide biosynthesis/export protein n=1 Tax=Rubripirellula lacrimiformis TaxID=1930273 RepID=A0A517N593_9BACT|nr:polysaccharide biosynthesis/export family protein [Rubripirellula lacrimiformis]QDT02305.1 Polysaccharide biosynthesis/export protein [Rubripirellula lacrimiformis]